ADGDFSGEQVLNAQVPLIDIRVARLFSSEVVAVVIAPHGERAVGVSLRLRDTEREGVRERCELRLVVVGREQDWIGCAVCGTGILEVRGRAQTEINARAAAQHGL